MIRKQEIILFIDTSKQDTVSVGVSIDGVRFDTSSQSKVVKAQMVLPLIERLLKEQNVRINDVTAIQVHAGPGSFTGIRVGLSVANALGAYLHIPVNGKRSLAESRY